MCPGRWWPTFWGSGLLMMVWCRSSQRPAAISPANNGLITHEAMIPDRPFQPQFRQPQLVAAAVMPTTAPTMACVVLTGMELRIAGGRPVT